MHAADNHAHRQQRKHRTSRTHNHVYSGTQLHLRSVCNVLRYTKLFSFLIPLSNCINLWIVCICHSFHSYERQPKKLTSFFFKILVSKSHKYVYSHYFLHLWTIENTIITLFLLISEYSKIVDQKILLEFLYLLCYNY